MVPLNGVQTVKITTAVILLVSALLTILRWPSQSSVYQNECSDISILEKRNLPDFWLATTSTKRIRIQPQHGYTGCNALAMAQFSARVRVNELLQQLPPATQSTIGVYDFDLTTVSHLQGQMRTIEVVLEFGYFPGAEQCQPCLGRICRADDLSKLGLKWIGEPIPVKQQVHSGDWYLAQLPNRYLKSSLWDSKWPTCQIFDPLPGVWKNSTPGEFIYLSGANLQPCSLLQPTLPTTQKAGSELVWIRFVGDSNFRQFFGVLIGQLGLRQCLTYTRRPEPNPTHRICWNDHIVLTFEWYFVGWDPEQSAKELSFFFKSSLVDFLESTPFGHNETWAPLMKMDSTPRRIYLSLGSHAPELAASGLQEYFELISPLVSISLSLRLVLTPATSASRIPTRFGPQSIMRNNIILHASNGLLRSFAHKVNIPCIDLFTSTQVLSNGPGMVDAVHFPEDVYKSWGSLLYTEWVRGP